jgi:hypothetical protein
LFDSACGRALLVVEISVGGVTLRSEGGILKYDGGTEGLGVLDAKGVVSM